MDVAREADGQQPSLTSIRGMFADAGGRSSAAYEPEAFEDDDDDGYGPKRPKRSKV